MEFVIFPITDSELFNYGFSMVAMWIPIIAGIGWVLRIVSRS